MRPLSSAEISRMESTTTASFPDLCTVDILSTSRNSFGEEVRTFTSGSQISCGFELVGGVEDRTNGLIVIHTRAMFNLPLGTTISIKDRITLKRRYNQTVNLQYEVVSEPVKNLDCIRVECAFVGV